MAKTKKGWLCMKPVTLMVEGNREPSKLPEGCLALFAVYKTKKAARIVAGPKAILEQVELIYPLEKRNVDSRRRR